MKADDVFGNEDKAYKAGYRRKPSQFYPDFLIIGILFNSFNSDSIKEQPVL
jgi:hypothetical protein